MDLLRIIQYVYTIFSKEIKSILLSDFFLFSLLIPSWERLNQSHGWLDGIH